MFEAVVSAIGRGVVQFGAGTSGAERVGPTASSVASEDPMSETGECGLADFRAGMAEGGPGVFGPDMPACEQRVSKAHVSGIGFGATETVASKIEQEIPFGVAVESGIELLRALDRRRSGVTAARRAAATWAAAHPELDAQLVVDARPGTPVVDYDLLVAHPDGGTVALTAPSDDGISWPVDHSTHWAANQLVSVDGAHLSLPDAFLMLRGLTGRNGSAHDDIVDHCLLVAASRDEPLVDGDVQEAADAFRRRRGLHGRQAVLAWLDRMGMTAEQFEEEVTALARRIRFRRRKEAELAPGYLARHRGDFDRVTAAWVIGPHPFPGADATEFLANLPRVLADEGAAEATLCERVASGLPEPLRDAPVGVVVGPLQPEAWYAGARSGDGRVAGRPSYQEGRGGVPSRGVRAGSVSVPAASSSGMRSRPDGVPGDASAQGAHPTDGARQSSGADADRAWSTDADGSLAGSGADAGGTLFSGAHVGGAGGGLARSSADVHEALSSGAHVDAAWSTDAGDGLAGSGADAGGTLFSGARSGGGGLTDRSSADVGGTYSSGAEAGRTYFSGVVLDRRPAADGDPAVLAAAGRVAFAEWLAERRARASVTWHWL
ncbi:TIGR04500 family putative peptide maturation system protein [Microtetraspora fusca]|uniref:TIGR04500 family putative peptide maturation system protein n=1 Tax=Microtetraspora fusca TaxID=1997 RepID=UPI001470E382|nr:TIGR04500 family putative peptide maturation system protein [Microtetraspora fusca]